MTVKRLTLMRKKMRFMLEPHKHNSRRHKLHNNNRRAAHQEEVLSQLLCRRNSRMTMMKKKTKMEVRRFQAHTILLSTLVCKYQVKSKSCLSIFNVTSLRK
jgi:hypothetical protein